MQLKNLSNKQAVQEGLQSLQTKDTPQQDVLPVLTPKHELCLQGQRNKGGFISSSPAPFSQLTLSSCVAFISD